MVRNTSSNRTLLRRVLSLFLLLAIMGPGAWLATADTASAQPITLDGDLSDWTDPDASAPDPCNDVIPLCKSGFDFTEIFVYYDEDSDTLFLGYDVMDAIGPCLQSPDPDPTRDVHGVPGDADGDNDPGAKTSIACIQGVDQGICVGRDEFYTFDIDTNLNLIFTDPEDLRLKYEGKGLSLERGDGTLIENWPINIVVGMAARTNGGPCPNENPNTFDIELSIERYSELDDIPVCYSVDVFSGSQVDGPVEDFLDEPLIVNKKTDPGIEVLKSIRNTTVSGEMGPFDDKRVAGKPGDVISFKVQVTNTGNIRLENIMVEDTLPDDYENIVENEAGCMLDNQKITCMIASLEPGASQEFEYSATIVQNPTKRVIINTARATGTSASEGAGSDLCGGDPVEDEDNARVALLDIVCVKEVSVDGGITYGPTGTAVPGQRVFFRVTVTNPTLGPLNNIVLSDQLVDGYDMPQDESGGLCIPNIPGNSITCTVDEIAAEMAVEFIYSARVRPEPFPNPPVLPNTANISAEFIPTQGDPIPLTTSCMADVMVIEPSVICEKLVSLDGVNFGSEVFAANCQTVYFRVTVTNDGDTDLFDVMIDDLLPPEFSNVDLGGGSLCGQAMEGNRIRVTCDLGTLNPDGSTTVNFSATFDGTANGARITNTANITATPGVGPEPEQQGEPIMTSCDADVVTQVPIINCVSGVSLSQGGPFVQNLDAVAGQEVFFEVRVTNAGSAAFFQTNVQDTLPPDCFGDITVVSPSISCANGTSIDCDLGPLNPGSSLTIVYRATLIKIDGLCTNDVSVTGTPGTLDNPGCPAMNTCSANVNALLAEILCEKGVSLSESGPFVPEITVQPGDTVFFEVLVDVTAQNEACFLDVELMDQLSDVFTNVTIIEGMSCATTGAGNRTISCPDLAPAPCWPADGDPRPLRVLYSAVVRDDLETFPDPITNTAMIDATPGVPGSDVGGTIIETECMAMLRVLQLDIICEKVGTPDPAIRGQKVTFEVTITNTSPSDATFTNVRLEDTLSAGFELGSINVLEPLNVCDINQAARTIECDLGPLAQNDSLTVRYEARVAEDAGPSVLNDATVFGVFGDDEIEVMSDCSDTIAVLDPCIECLKEGSLSLEGPYGQDLDILPGQRAYFRVTITNCGEVPFRQVSLTDMLPTGFSDVRIENGSACEVSGGTTVVCNDLGPLGTEPNAKIEVFFSALLSATQDPGGLTNIAVITGFTGSKENPGIEADNNCELPIDVLDVDFICRKLVSLDGVNFSETVEAVPGQLVYFKVEVENTGDVRVALRLTDDLGSAYENPMTNDGAICEFGGAFGNVLTCEFEIDPGPANVRTLTYDARLRENVSPGTYVNTVDLEGEGVIGGIEGGTIERPNACQANVVVLDPAIICEKGVSLDGVGFQTNLFVQPGDRVFFRVIIRNTGFAPLRDITLEDIVPIECFENVMVMDPDPTGTCTEDNNRINCMLGDLEPDEEITVLYEADVKLEPAADECTNTVRITAKTGTEENEGITIETECSASVTTIVIPIPTLGEIGQALMILLLGATLVIYYRRRVG